MPRPPRARASRERRPARRWLRRAGRLAALLLALFAVAAAAVAAWTWLTWPDVERLARESPETTAFIESHRGRAGEVDWTWVPYGQISRHLKHAVVAAEDINFFSHDGFDRSEIRAAIAEWREGKRLRGASTLTQQLAKNLWLTPSRNPLRKLEEALLTVQLERHLEKRRILELYLNVAQFGPGVFGAEAAARRYFGKPAARLTLEESALLAAALPRPSSWHPGVDSRGYRRRAATIRARVGQSAWLARSL